MSDTVKAWIEERQTIHSDGTGVLLRNPYELNREYDLWDEDAEAIADAHNMFPLALDALNAVLELHRRAVDIFEPLEFCAACSTNQRTVEWPCPTVQAVQAAIAGGR